MTNQTSYYSIRPANDLEGTYNVHATGHDQPVASYFTTRTAAQNWIDSQDRITITDLRAYPGWQIRHNQRTGMYWAYQTNGLAMGPGEPTFNAALQFVKTGQPAT